MNRKRSVIIGASTGLVFGIIMFAIGLWLRHAPEPVLTNAFLCIHAPALGLMSCLHGTGYDWNSNAGLLQILAVFLGYWTLLGTLVGLGWRMILSWRHTSHVA